MDYPRWLESDQSPGPRRLRQSLSELISKAEAFGLPEKDVRIAQEFVDYNEPGCALQHLATQLYEYGTSIDAEYYQLLKAAAATMLLPEQDFLFVKELIK